ncbi:Fungal specific transcription factor domain-containing protein [Cladophialophora immunda]|nr:Fungal specific transcription factor domain-containing protein [Cladophialophora immunda]
MGEYFFEDEIDLDDNTICPQDLLLLKCEDSEKQPHIDFITIPSDDLEEPSDSGKSLGSDVESTCDETESNDDWLEVHNLLFQSVGLERLPECWKLVKERLKENSLDHCNQSTADPPISKDIQDQLIPLYFRQFHPVCPAVDETEFLRWRQKSKESSFDDPQPMQLLLVSMMFAASPYLDESLLSQGPYSSVKSLQEALFTSAQSLYHNLETEFLGAEPLAQSALLLSYWSNNDSTTEVNSYWSDEAVRHAVAGGMSALSSTGRRRIIWWCCLIRNRMISLGLRRFTRLETRPDGRLPETTDFGKEVSRPHFTSPESKIYFTRAFALMCSLTRIMAESVWLPYREYNKPWSLPTDRRAFRLMKTVGQLDEELEAWTFKFNRVYSTIREMAVPNADLVIFHLIGLMHQFAISILYEPFLRLSESNGEQVWFVRDLALLKIKEVSKNTAAITASMLQFAKPKDLPIILPPWIILPIALHLVQLSAPQVLEIKAQTTQQLGYLMRALHSLTCRYESVKLVTRIIDAIIVFVRDSQEESPLTRAQAVCSQERAVQARDPHLGQEKVITRVLEFIRNGLAEGVTQA